MKRTMTRAAVLTAIALALATGAFAQRTTANAAKAPAVKPARAAKPAKAEAAGDAAVPSDNYDELFQTYLKAARAVQTPAAPGGLWMAGLLSDLRARNINDLVTIRITETVSAQGSADSNLDKNSSASAAVGKLFGLESKYPGWLDPSSLAALSANTKFKGSGSTARTGELSAVLTARVTEVLPNGDLDVEGVREIDINGDRQILVLTGVVRQADIGPGNVVPSTAVGQMRVRYFGRGLMKDNLSPGWLVRILNKIF